MHRLLLACALLAATASHSLAASAAAEDVDVTCTIMLDAATGKVLVEEGDCATRTTPASTFKIPLALIGYDTKFLKDETTPVLAYQKGDPDWGGANWLRDTNPTDWLRYSVVWYSQRITRDLGRDTLERYARAFQYGNADLSGDPGFDNGLERAWIASSLQISPREQVAFLRGLVNGTLPVGAEAIEKTRRIVERRDAGDWTLHGKTGAAFPRRADRSFDYAHGWGWYVGWAEQKGHADGAVVFARLIRTREQTKTSPGVLTRDALIAQWPALSRTLGR
ncbi:class D beta-lactamase [Rhizobium sp. Leaf384]|uniref:class D beta-lactamase n=1 Tax=unclassified Rhizobium TaxID=2613769 RepID=UPI000713807C|nr:MULTISPECIES: class D beta-lactamase [unclassified Rhizobium]KQS77432.1 class D beta-lactamase [Rhizobium sp. Leaf383]KQS80660.1 class D beta-lactamase [Rhizobium sp. Leaf384]